MDQQLSRCTSLMLDKQRREYREPPPDGYGCSQYRELYRDLKAQR